MFAREFLGNSLRLVVRQTLTTMPNSTHGVHVAFKHIKVSRALKAAISDTSMPLAKVVTQTLTTEIAAAGSPR